MKIIIIGLGNPILTDDGIGVKVAESIASYLAGDEAVDVTEVSIGGLSLMEAMVGYNKVILIDALQTRDGRPGSIHRMTLDDLKSISPTQHNASPHDVNLVTALEFGEKMGLSLPSDVTIFGIEVQNVTDFSEMPTPEVAAAIPLVTEAVLREIHREPLLA
jgi:hydrogenase maturation protease